MKFNVQDTAKAIIAIYATIEGNKLKNAYEIGKRLTKVEQNAGKTLYKEVTELLMKSNKVEKTTLAKYRKLYTRVEPFVHADSTFLDTLKTATSFTVAEKLTDLDKVKLAELMQGLSTTYNAFISSLTVSDAEHFVWLIKTEGKTISEAIAIMPTFTEYMKQIEEANATTEEEATEEGEAPQEEAKAPTIAEMMEQALSFILSNAEVLTSIQIDLLIQAVETGTKAEEAKKQAEEAVTK